MQEFINAISSPGSMNTSQWLVFAIGLFIILGALYFILKLYKLIKGVGKSTYKPNIGISKHPYRGQPVSAVGQPQTSTDAPSAVDSAAQSMDESAAASVQKRED